MSVPPSPTPGKHSNPVDPGTATKKTSETETETFDGFTFVWHCQPGKLNDALKQQLFWTLMLPMEYEGNRRGAEHLNSIKDFGKFAKTHKRKIDIVACLEPYSPANKACSVSLARSVLS